MLARKLIAGGLILSYPVAVHLAVVLGRPRLALIALLLICLAFLVLRLIQDEARGISMVLLGAMIVLTTVNLWAGEALMLYVIPVLINLLLLVVFARTLLPGRTPLIARFRQLEEGDNLPPDVAVYTRKVTWVWSVLFASMAIISALLAVLASAKVWSLFTNCISYLIVAALLVGEYGFRRWCLRYHVQSPLQFARGLMRADWARLAR